MLIRRLIPRAAVFLLFLSASSPVLAQDPGPVVEEVGGSAETDVLAVLNKSRTDPSDYAKTLLAYRTMFRGQLVISPGQNADVQTDEGVAPVDEAIQFLSVHRPLAPLQASEVLQSAAADLVADQSKSGRTGHLGANGARPSDRTLKHGGGAQVAELIAYGATDADDVIRQLLIDDGVPGRGHRLAMFYDHLRYAGIACGPHPTFRTMCVIDMADTIDAKQPLQ